MRGKLFKHLFLVAMAVFVACTTLTMCSLYSYFSEERMTSQKEEAAYIAAAVEEGGEGFLKRYFPESSTRVTWIDRDGTVLYDSTAQAETMENHASREEVKQALETGKGESSRYSNTLSQKTTNYAIRLKDGTVVRISGTQYTMVSLIVEQFYGMVAVLVLAVALSAALAFRASKSIVEPINGINLENPDERDVYPELKPLIRRIGGQNRQIQFQMQALRQAHKQQDTLRREFTANVSHELKTPLTSISGYAEIIREGVAKPEDVTRFAGKIYDEAQRLVALVEDIIRLSRLESRETVYEKREVVLYEISQRVLARLEHAAQRQEVTLELTGTMGVFWGVEQVAEEIVFNLCDNAIKYNRPGGRVSVSITETEQQVTVEVKDTGIGIPDDETERIFERFYRVDKSHSRAVGGTGLGLSIVKHGAAYHDAKIKIHSTVGVGTAISVTFPKA